MHYSVASSGWPKALRCTARVMTASLTGKPKRSAVLKIVNQNCCLPEIEIQEALLVKQISLNIIILADNKTARHFRDRHEVIDDDSEAYCWRRSGFFWRMRASLGLACAQATTLASQVFGKGNPRSRAGRPSI